MRVDNLLLHDGSLIQAVLVDNDILRERVWRCGDDYIFECQVKEINPKSVLLVAEENTEI